jgi:hypothetical protein
MADDATIRAIADELTQRHGGREALGVSGTAIIFQVASLLAGGAMTRADAATVEALIALLPAAEGRQVEATAKWNLESLSEEDFGNLVSIAARAGVLVVREDGLGIPPLPDGARTVADLVAELTDTRRRAWAAEEELHRVRSELVRVEDELTKHRAALTEVAKALAEAEAKSGAAADGNAPANSAEVGNVVPLRPRTPAGIVRLHGFDRDQRLQLPR